MLRLSNIDVGYTSRFFWMSRILLEKMYQNINLF